MAQWPTDEQIDILFPNNTSGDITALIMRNFLKSQSDAGQDLNATNFEDVSEATGVVADDDVIVVKGDTAYRYGYDAFLGSIWDNDGTKNLITLAPNQDRVKWIEVRRRSAEVYVPQLRIDLRLENSYGGSTTVEIGSVLLPTAIEDAPQTPRYLVIDFSDVMNVTWQLTTDKQLAIETTTTACILVMHYQAVWARPGLEIQPEVFSQGYGTAAPRHWLTQVANPAFYKLRKGWVGSPDISIIHPPSALSGTPLDMPDGTHWECTHIPKGTELLYTTSGGTTARATLYSGYNETMEAVPFRGRTYTKAVVSGSGKIVKRGNGDTEIIPSATGTVTYSMSPPPIGEYNIVTLGQSLSELVVKEGGPGGFQAVAENAYKEDDPGTPEDESLPRFSFNMVNGGSGGSSMCRTSPLAADSTNYWKDLSVNGGVGETADGGAFTNFKAFIDRSIEIGQMAPSIIFFDQGGGETRAITNGDTTIQEYRQAMDLVISEAREYIRVNYEISQFPGSVRVAPLVCVIPFNSSDKEDEAHAITLLRREHISYTQDNPSYCVEHPNRNILYRAGMEPHYDGSGSAGLGGMMARTFIKSVILPQHNQTAADNYALGPYLVTGRVFRVNSSLVTFEMRNPTGFRLLLPGGITGEYASAGATPFDFGILDAATGDQIELAGAACVDGNTVELYGRDNIPEEFDIMYPMRLGRDSYLAGDYPTAVTGYEAPVDRFNGVVTLPLLPFLYKFRST